MSVVQQIIYARSVKIHVWISNINSTVWSKKTCNETNLKYYTKHKGQQQQAVHGELTVTVTVGRRSFSFINIK